jgi:hypothetical protein
MNTLCLSLASSLPQSFSVASIGRSDELDWTPDEHDRTTRIELISHGSDNSSNIDERWHLETLLCNLLLWMTSSHSFRITCGQHGGE